MNKEEVKEILVSIQNHLEKYEEKFKNGAVDSTTYYLYCDDARSLLNYITNLQEENKRLKDLYEKTCKHLFNIGNDELARYFQAQINECNVFVPQDLRCEDKPQYLGYSDKECINCGRLRVEKYSDGTEICEKCNFDQNKKEYV